MLTTKANVKQSVRSVLSVAGMGSPMPYSAPAACACLHNGRETGPFPRSLLSSSAVSLSRTIRLPFSYVLFNPPLCAEKVASQPPFPSHISDELFFFKDKVTCSTIRQMQRGAEGRRTRPDSPRSLAKGAAHTP